MNDRTPTSPRSPLGGLSSTIAITCLTFTVAAGGAFAWAPQDAPDAEATPERPAKVTTPEELELAKSMMLRMYKDGEITREQMMQRLNRMRASMKDSPATGQSAMAKKRYADAVARMTEMVESGEMTREQMQQRLDRLRASMKDAKPARITQKDIDEATAKMTELVEQGRITREDMQARLNEMVRTMDQQRRAARERYAETESRLQQMVADGTITSEQMEQRLNRLRLDLFPEAADQDRRAARAEYAEAAGRLQELVDAGEITSEQMDQRLNRLRMKLFPNADGERRGARRGLPTPPEGASRAELREWYMRIQERLEMAVESGRLSQEEAERMLLEIRERLR